METFVLQAIELLRRKAGQARSDPDSAMLDLAAHLFAIGCYLTGSDVTVGDFSQPPKSISLSEMLASLERPQTSLDAPGLYRRVIGALVTIEAEFSNVTRDADTVSGWTPIETLDLGSTRVLGGEVRRWLRPGSALARLRDCRDEEASENREAQSTSLRPHPMTHLRTLAMYWVDPRAPVVEPIESRGRTVALIEESGRRASHRGSFRVALCPLRGSFHPLFEIGPTGRHFTVSRGREPMAGREQLYRHLSAIAEAAAQQDIQLLMLPELTVDPEARQVLINEIRKQSSRPAGVVAGSFHVWPDETREALPVNETVLCDPYGRPLLEHRKRGRFRLTPQQVGNGTQFWAQPRFFWEGKELRADPPISLREEILEKIRQGRTLRLLETTLGRLVILICADAIEPDPLGYVPLVENLRPDLLLVVAMSHETDRFDDFADRMAHHRIGTLFVNAACVCGQDRRPNLAACDLGLHQPPGSAPTRVRWRAGEQDVVEIYERHPVKGSPTGWLPLGAEPGVSWLESPGGSPLGLVLDLGIHWQK